MINWRFSLNDISHAHMPRIMNELQTSPPQEQETSARAKLIETRRGQTGGHLNSKSPGSDLVNIKVASARGKAT